MTAVHWSPRAIDDLQSIYEFIAADSAHYAALVVARLVRSVDRLGEFPLSGRVVPELGDPHLREIVDPPYRIVYRIRADGNVDVVTVFRASRLLPGLES